MSAAGLETLSAWYGSREAAQAVLDGLLGDADRALKKAKSVQAKRRKATWRLTRAAEIVALAEDPGTFVHARTAAPSKCDMVAQALDARPDFQKAWN